MPGGRIGGGRGAAGHKERARLWQKLNDRESVRPMVWINEICWHEMDVDGELTLQTKHPWAPEQERELRRTLYQWRRLPGDMVAASIFLTCPLAIHSTDFGILEDVNIATTDPAADVASRHFHIQARNLPDLGIAAHLCGRGGQGISNCKADRVWKQGELPGKEGKKWEN